MGLSAGDKQVVQDLAKRVNEIAALPVMEEKKRLWYRLNSCQRVRPLIHCQAIAPDIWEELIPPETLQCTDLLARKEELRLRAIIYAWETFPDDRVVDPNAYSYIVVCGDSFVTDYGVKADYARPAEKYGAVGFRPVIKTEADIEMIEAEPKVWVDWDKTDRDHDALCDLYGDATTVKKICPEYGLGVGYIDSFIRWRGIEQMFIDLLDRPKWIHEVLERMLAASVSSMRQCEELGILTLNNTYCMLGTGGYGWTDDLPAPDFDGERVRVKDLWGRTSTQIFTEGISPEMHWEFAIQYEKRFLEHFGLAGYGCCEPLHNKMQFVSQIENLRRVSMSPWVDIDKASEVVGTKYVYTHKPHPAVVSMEKWHPDLARQQLEDALRKTRTNVVEVNLQDIHTVRGQPHRLTEWTKMAMELSEQYA